MKFFVTFEKYKFHLSNNLLGQPKERSLWLLHKDSRRHQKPPLFFSHLSKAFKWNQSQFVAYYTWFAQLPAFTPQGHLFRSAWELKASILGGLSITTSNSSSPTKPKYLQSSSSFSSTPKGWHASAHSPFPEHKQFNTLSFPSALATLFLVFLFIQSSWSLQINRAQLHLVSSHLTPSELVPHPCKTKQDCQLSRSLPGLASLPVKTV